MQCKSLKLGIVLALTCTLSACGEDDNDGDKSTKDGKTPPTEEQDQTNACTENDKKCDGDYVMMCVNGVWETNSKPCANGCLAGNCMADEVVCNEDERRCHGDELQICLNNAWKEIETCTNGCNEIAKKCKSSSDTPVTPQPDPPSANCTENDKKCVGDDVTICTSGAWEIVENCPYGCESSKCIEKTDNPADPDSYCIGDVLHTWISGKEFKTTCSYKGLECQLLKDGTSACVYNHDLVKDSCLQDNLLTAAKCIAPEDLGFESTHEYIGYSRCVTNSKGVIVGIKDQGWEVCGIYNGERVLLKCDKMSLTKSKCENCVNDGIVASCDNMSDASELLNSTYCGTQAYDAKKTLDEACAPAKGFCFEDHQICLETCSVKKATKSICDKTTTGDKYLHRIHECNVVDGLMVYVPIKYEYCASTCNTTYTDCK